MTFGYVQCLILPHPSSLALTSVSQISAPNGNYLNHQHSVSSGEHSFTADADGKYLYCFSNEAWSANSKEVSFNVHGVVYVPEHEAPQDPLEKEVKALTEMLEWVMDEQGYIVVRERTHRNTAESTNARVKWWSIFQLGVLMGEGVFQIWWLKRFFEVSRVLVARCTMILTLCRSSEWFKMMYADLDATSPDQHTLFTTCGSVQNESTSILSNLTKYVY